MNDYYDPVGLIDCAPMVIGDWRSQVGAKSVVEVGDRLKTYEMSWDVIDLADAEARCLGIVARKAAHAGLIDWGLLTPLVVGSFFKSLYTAIRSNDEALATRWGFFNA